MLFELIGVILATGVFVLNSLQADKSNNYLYYNDNQKMIFGRLLWRYP